MQGYLGEIPIFDVDPGHAVQPRLPELRGAGVGLGQTVLEVHQHLWVVLVLLHLGRGHQDRAYPFGQVLHVRGEGGVLKQEWENTWFSAVFGLSMYMVERRQRLGGEKDNGTRGTHLDEPVAVGTVVDDRQGLLKSGSPDPHNICYQLADGNNDLRDTNVSKSIHLQMPPHLGSAPAFR